MFKREHGIVTWQDIRDEVKLVNPELYHIIEDINPGPKYKLVKANYAYGDLIIEQGVTRLPNAQNGFSTVDEIKALQPLLSYSPIPLLLTLKKDNEVFINTGTRIIPLNLFHQGSILGLFETLNFYFGIDAKPIWNVSAGARSILMLPRVADSLGLKRLRSYYNFPSTTRLKYMSDHWQIFKFIAQHEQTTNPWSNEVLFFAKEWIKSMNKPKWAEFNKYISKHAWHQAQPPMSKIALSLIWENFVEAISYRNLKPRPYLADQVKHLLAIATHKSPGFIAIDTTKNAAPTDIIQQAFLEVYALKQYQPTLLHTTHLSTHEHSPTYYSLSFPTLLEGSPLNKSSSTILSDLRDIKLLIDTLHQHLANRSNNRLTNTDFITKTEFDYFHIEPDPMGDISPSTELTKFDPSLSKNNQFTDREFCTSSPFWRGCISIKREH